jgi:hypothetical protein
VPRIDEIEFVDIFVQYSSVVSFFDSDISPVVPDRIIIVIQQSFRDIVKTDMPFIIIIKHPISCSP